MCTIAKTQLLPVSVKETLLFCEPLACNPAAETALQPLIRCSERLFPRVFSPEYFFSQTPALRHVSMEMLHLSRDVFKWAPPTRAGRLWKIRRPHGTPRPQRPAEGAEGSGGKGRGYERGESCMKAHQRTSTIQIKQLMDNMCTKRKAYAYLDHQTLMYVSKARQAHRDH